MVEFLVQRCMSIQNITISLIVSDLWIVSLSGHIGDLAIEVAELVYGHETFKS